jgi:hypothetical protein
MKLKSLILCAFCLAGAESAQAANGAAFDSTANYMGENIKAYIGQELTVRPRTADLQKMGYTRFFTSKSLADVYQPAENHNSTYEKLNGRTFKCTGVESRPIDATNQEKAEGWKSLPADSIYYLVLNDGAETLYYKYTRFEGNFPFTVKGYQDKMRKQNVGDKYYLTKTTDKFWKDDVTGKDFNLVMCSLWTVTDVALDDDCITMAAVMKSTSGQTKNVGLKLIKNYFMTQSYIDGLKRKYTPAVFNKTVIAHKINPGTPAELLKVAFGEPTKIGKASSYQVWFYGTQQVKIQNGKVVM